MTIEFGFGPEGDMLLLGTAMFWGFAVALGLLVLSLVTHEIIKFIGGLWHR
jgi:hypothetical protein